MRGGCVHSFRPVFLAIANELAKMFPRHQLRRLWTAPHFVERQQRVIDIERRVFDTFGYDGAGELLPAHYEGESLFALIGKNVRRVCQGEDIPQEVETCAA